MKALGYTTCALAMLAVLVTNIAAAEEAMPLQGDHAAHMATGPVPTAPGQEAFGTVQEIVAILEADPATDWSKVDIDALRDHLIDMNEIALTADAAVEHLPDGIKVRVTGKGRTLAAINRLIPAQAQQLAQLGIWQTRAEPIADGIVLTVRSNDPAEVTKIKGLGFFGVITSGQHHQPHHLMIATGQHF